MRHTRAGAEVERLGRTAQGIRVELVPQGRDITAGQRQEAVRTLGVAEVEVAEQMDATLREVVGDAEVPAY